jgi:hypothetical protein
VLVSNQRPHPCKGCALPPELTAPCNRELLYKNWLGIYLAVLRAVKEKGRALSPDGVIIHTQSESVSYMPFGAPNRPFAHL